MQRLLITFTRGDQTKYISHLDMMRFWERAFRRAQLAVATSNGFHPHLRFTLASPLPVGVTSEAELMEVYLETPVAPESCQEVLSAQSVPSITIKSVTEMQLTLPSLQARMRFAEYRVAVKCTRSATEVAQAVAQLIALQTLAWEHLRDSEVRHYDLRAQIAEVALVSVESGIATLTMRLQCDGSASGRPEQVARALGFEEQPESILRTNLVLSDGASKVLNPSR